MTTKSSTSTAPSASSYVLPAPKRPTPDVIVVPSRMGAALERSGQVARVIGERFLALAECQQQFLGELRNRLEVLDGAIADDSRAQMKGALREVTAVLDWCDSVQADLQEESRRAAAGREPLDLGAECADLVAGFAGGNDIDVVSTAATRWWGDAKALHEAVCHGLTLVSERTAGQGRRRIEIGTAEDSAWIRIASSGEPGDSLDVDSVRRFRGAVTRLGARVVPDALGPGGAGFLLVLPHQEPAGLGSDAGS